MWPIWVSTETAIKLQHSDEGIKLIEVRWPIFLWIVWKFLCILEIRWPHHKNSQNVTNFFWWLLRYIHSPEQMSSILAGKRGNPGQAGVGRVRRAVTRGRGVRNHRRGVGGRKAMSLMFLQNTGGWERRSYLYIYLGEQYGQHRGKDDRWGRGWMCLLVIARE